MVNSIKLAFLQVKEFCIGSSLCQEFFVRSEFNDRLKKNVKVSIAGIYPTSIIPYKPCRQPQSCPLVVLYGWRSGYISTSKADTK
jgi:hypothetical protein